MEILVTSTESIPNIRLQGRLDGYGASLFDEKAAILDEASRYVIIDMSAVDYLSSSGIRSLVKLEKTLRQKEGRALLVAPSSFVQQVLKTTGLLHRFSSADSVQEALELIEGFRSSDGTQARVSLNGRAYTLRWTCDGSSVLDLWGIPSGRMGSGSTDRSLTAATLAELGIAFGIGGFGSSSRQAMGVLGEFLCTGSVAGVIPADGHCLPDFVTSDDPQQVTVFTDGAIGFSGTPSFAVRSETSGPCSLKGLVVDLLQVADGQRGFSIPLAGVVLLAHVVETVASHFRNPEDLLKGLAATSEEKKGEGAPKAVLLVGLAVREAFLEPGDAARLNPVLAQLRTPAGSGGLIFHGHAFLLEELPEISQNQDLHGLLRQLANVELLQGVAHMELESVVGMQCAWVYTPSSLRSGDEKRLGIEWDGEGKLPEEWEVITRRIYADAGRVVLGRIHGGFMSETFRATSYDREGRKMLPTVLKIGPLDLTRREEGAYRRCVEKYILNNATTIMGTASYGAWAGLRYNFLGINGPDSSISWLTDHYRRRPISELIPLFRNLFTGVLKPWYGQPKWETLQPYAEHDPMRLFKRIPEDAERELAISPEAETIPCDELGVTLPNPYHFLKYQYGARRNLVVPWYRSITHGDLNLQNVLVDEKDNLYVIDFSETRERSIVADFARLEPILKLELTRLENQRDLQELMEFERGIAVPSVLGEPPVYTYRGNDPMVEKAYVVICLLRELADKVTLFEENIVPYLLAVLEWTLPVVSYRSANALQKRLSAYSAALLVQRILEIERERN